MAGVSDVACCTGIVCDEQREFGFSIMPDRDVDVGKLLSTEIGSLGLSCGVAASKTTGNECTSGPFLAFLVGLSSLLVMSDAIFQFTGSRDSWNPSWPSVRCKGGCIAVRREEFVDNKY